MKQSIKQCLKGIMTTTLLATTCSFAASAATIDDISGYAVQICEKAYSCNAEKMANIPPEMKAQMEQMLAGVKAQCGQQMVTAANDAVATNPQVATVLEDVKKCYASMATASCDYYQGVKSPEELPACVNMKASAEEMQLATPGS